MNNNLSGNKTSKTILCFLSLVFGALRRRALPRIRRPKYPRPRIVLLRSLKTFLGRKPEAIECNGAASKVTSAEKPKRKKQIYIYKKKKNHSCFPQLNGGTHHTCFVGTNSFSIFWSYQDEILVSQRI